MCNQDHLESCLCRLLCNSLAPVWFVSVSTAITSKNSVLQTICSKIAVFKFYYMADMLLEDLILNI